jgi:hypothetical protein
MYMGQRFKVLSGDKGVRIGFLRGILEYME